LSYISNQRSRSCNAQQARHRHSRRIGLLGQAQRPGQLGQSVRDQLWLFRGHPPHHVVVTAVAVGVLNGQRGLPDSPHSMYRLHHCRSVCAQGVAQADQKLLAASKGEVSGRYVPHPPHRHQLGAGPRQSHQRLEQHRLQPVGRGHRRRGQPTLDQPGPESLLPITVVTTDKQVPRALCLITEQEHQPRLATLTGGLELQFGVGQLRLISHR
jgi:hypothetical protein